MSQPAGWKHRSTTARLSLGTRLSGPAVIEEMSATTLLHPGDRAELDTAGNLLVTLF